MNPRILKKLSKRVAVHAKAFGYSIDLEVATGCELTPRRASRKPSHRERYRRYDGTKAVGDLIAPEGTPWLCWSYCGPDGTEGDSAVAWLHLKFIVIDGARNAAIDWCAPASEHVNGWPPYINGRPPKLPRNTWQVLRLIEHEALVKQMAASIRRMRIEQKISLRSAKHID